MRLKIKKGKLHDPRPKIGARRMRKGLEQYDLQSQLGFHEKNNPEKITEKAKRKNARESIYFCFESLRYT